LCGGAGDRFGASDFRGDSGGGRGSRMLGRGVAQSRHLRAHLVELRVAPALGFRPQFRDLAGQACVGFRLGALRFLVERGLGQCAGLGCRGLAAVFGVGLIGEAGAFRFLADVCDLRLQPRVRFLPQSGGFGFAARGRRLLRPRLSRRASPLHARVRSAPGAARPWPARLLARAFELFLQSLLRPRGARRASSSSSARASRVAASRMRSASTFNSRLARRASSP
jgi:hypothetical protein